MNKVVCIDAGHGGSDPGAVNGKYQEKKAALGMALSLGTLLEKAGYKVVYTRTDDKYKALSERCRISNAAKADAFISIHLNAATNKAAAGIETWRYTNVGTTTAKLANAIQDNLIADTGAKDRKVKNSDVLYVLKHTIAPAVLVETGFISNDSECKNLFSMQYQTKVVRAIYKGIVSVVK